MSLGVPATLIISNVKRAYNEFRKATDHAQKLDAQGNLITNLELACTALCVGGEEFVREIKCSDWVQTCAAILSTTVRGTHMEVESLAMRVLALIADTVPKGTFAITKKTHKTVALLASYLAEPDFLLQHEDFTEDLLRCLCFISASSRDPLVENNVLGLLVSLDPIIGEKHLRRLCLLTCGNLLRSARATEWPLLHQAITQLVENTFDFCALVLRLNNNQMPSQQLQLEDEGAEGDASPTAASPSFPATPSTRYQAHVAAAAAKAPAISVTEDEVVVLSRYCRCLGFIADRLLVSVHLLKKYSPIVDNLMRLSTTLILFSAKTKGKTCDLFRSAGCSILLSLYFTDPAYAMMLFINSNVFDAVCRSMLDSLHSTKQAIQDAASVGASDGEEEGEEEEGEEGAGATSIRQTTRQSLTTTRPASRVGLRNPSSPLGMGQEDTGTDFSRVGAGPLAASRLQLSEEASLALEESDTASPTTGLDSTTRRSDDALGATTTTDATGPGAADENTAAANPPPLPVVAAANEPQDSLAQQLLSDNITAVPLISDELSIIPLLEFLLVLLPVSKEPRAMTDSLSVTIPHYSWVWEDDFHNANPCAESLAFRTEREYARMRANGATWSTMFEVFHNGAKRPLIIDFANQLFINGSEMFPHTYAREPLLAGYRHVRLDGLEEGCECCKKTGEPKSAENTKCGAAEEEDEDDDDATTNGEEDVSRGAAAARSAAAPLPANLNELASMGTTEGNRGAAAAAVADTTAAAKPKRSKNHPGDKYKQVGTCCFCVPYYVVSKEHKDKKNAKRGLANPDGTGFTDQGALQQTGLTDARVTLLTSTATRSVYLTEATLTPLLSVCSPALVAIVKNTVNPIVARHISVLFLRIISLSTEYCCGKDAYDNFTVDQSAYRTGEVKYLSGKSRKSNLASVFNRKGNSSRRIEEMLTKLAPTFFSTLSYLYLTRTCEMKGYLSYAFPYKQLCDDVNMRETFQKIGIGKDFAAFYFNTSAEMNLSAGDALALLLFLYNRILQGPKEKEKEKKRGGNGNNNNNVNNVSFSSCGLALSPEAFAQCPLAAVLKKSQLELLLKCTKDRLREISALRRDGLYLQDLRLNEYAKVKKVSVRVAPTDRCPYHMNIESAWLSTEAFFTDMDCLLLSTLRQMQQGLTSSPSSPSRQKGTEAAGLQDDAAELLLTYSGHQLADGDVGQEEKPVWMGNQTPGGDEYGQQSQSGGGRIRMQENVNPLSVKQKMSGISSTSPTKSAGEEACLVTSSRHAAWLNAIDQRVQQMERMAATPGAASGTKGSSTTTTCTVKALWPALALYDELKSTHAEMRTVAEQCPDVLQRAAVSIMQWAAPLLQLETYQQVLKDKELYVKLNREYDAAKGPFNNPYFDSINWNTTLDEQLTAETRAKLTALLTDLTHTVDEQLGVAAADQLFPPLLINQSSNFEKRFSRNKTTTAYEELMWTPVAIALQPYQGAATAAANKADENERGPFDMEFTPVPFDEERFEITLKGRTFKCLPFPSEQTGALHVLMAISTITVGWLRLILLQHARHGSKSETTENAPSTPATGGGAGGAATTSTTGGGVQRTISSMFPTTRNGQLLPPGNANIPTTTGRGGSNADGGGSSGKPSKHGGRSPSAPTEEPVEALHSTETVQPAKDGEDSAQRTHNNKANNNTLPRSDDQILLLVDGVPLLSPHTTLLDALFYFSKTGHQLRQSCGLQMTSGSRATGDNQFTRFTNEIRQSTFWSTIHHIQFVILAEPLPLDFYEINFGCGCRPLMEGMPSTSSGGAQGRCDRQRDPIWPKTTVLPRRAEQLMGTGTPFYCSPAHIFTRMSPSGKTFHADATLQLLEALTLVTAGGSAANHANSHPANACGAHGAAAAAAATIGIANDQRRLSSSLVHDMFSQVPSFMLPCLMNVTMQKAMSGLFEGHLSSYAVWNYPHIFPLEMRVTLLEMFLSTRRRISARILRILRTFNVNQIRNRFLGFSWLAEPGVPQNPNPKRVSVTVDRKKILDGADMLRRYAWCSLPLDVCFRGEPGIGLGPALEFLEELGKSLMSPALGMWRTEEVPGTSPTEWVTSPFLYPSARQTLKTLRHFESLGLLLARLLLMRRTTNLRFHPLLLRRLLGQCIVEKQSLRGNFSLIDPTLARSLSQLESLSAEDLAATETYFVLPISEAPPLVRPTSNKARKSAITSEYAENADGEIELFAGGSTMQVTTANVREYTDRVRLYYLYYLPDLVLSRVRIGLHTALNSLHLRLFSVVELDLLLSGPQGKLWATPADFALDVVASHGYTRHSAVVQYLLELVPQWEKEEQRLFLRFITGSSAIPLSGRLSNPITVVRRDAAGGATGGGGGSATPNPMVSGGGSVVPVLTTTTVGTPPPPGPSGPRVSPPPLQMAVLSGTYGGADGDQVDFMLPTVSTCFNYLKLPCYSSKAVLERQLRRAIEEGQGAFMLT